MSTPLRVGLTGSIGMGKSTTARMFAAAGLPVWDADAAVHRLYEPGGGAVEAVGRLCRAAINAEAGIDREVLKDWISSTPDALKQLEGAVHPLVAADRAAFVSQSTAPAVVLDIPLLFETGAQSDMDLVVVVSTDLARQKARVLARPGMTEDRFNAILAKQTPDAVKRASADEIIYTDTMELARSGVARVLERIEILRKENHA